LQLRNNKDNITKAEFFIFTKYDDFYLKRISYCQIQYKILPSPGPAA
jgi:hypothetical protein